MMWRGVRNWPLVPDADELRQQILIHVAFEVVAVMRGKIELVDALNDGAQALGGRKS